VKWQDGPQSRQLKGEATKTYKELLKLYKSRNLYIKTLNFQKGKKGKAELAEAIAVTYKTQVHDFNKIGYLTSIYV